MEIYLRDWDWDFDSVTPCVGSWWVSDRISSFSEVEGN